MSKKQRIIINKISDNKYVEIFKKKIPFNKKLKFPELMKKYPRLSEIGIFINTPKIIKQNEVK